MLDVMKVDTTTSPQSLMQLKSWIGCIEQLKNGNCMNCMYGKFKQLLMNSPFVICFSNSPVDKILKFASPDRWRSACFSSSDKYTCKLIPYKTFGGGDMFLNGLYNNDDYKNSIMDDIDMDGEFISEEEMELLSKEEKENIEDLEECKGGVLCAV